MLKIVGVVRRLLVLAFAIAAPVAAALAQQLEAPVRVSAVRDALATIERDNAWTIEQQISICEIPAPPFKEAARAAEVVQRFKAHGLSNVRIDAEGNVIGERAGAGNGPTVVLSGHLDTVFPEGTNVKVRREGTVLHGPGIGDDCRGLATLLAVARAIHAHKVTFPGKILFVATVGEEGPGNLRGVRALFKAPPEKIDHFISVDGTGLGLTTGGVGSHRYLVQFQGPGGHSFGAFGMPAPIHAMGRAIATISDFTVPAKPKTTFNVGIVSGGTSVNTISPLGAMEVDLRSESPEELLRLDEKLKAAVQGAVDKENARAPNSQGKVTVKWTDMGVRPAVLMNDKTAAARAALAAAKALDFVAPTSAGSTDANIPMSMGVSAITMDGGGDGKGAHSLSESYDDGPRGYKGPQWVLLTTLMLAGLSAPNGPVP